MQWVLKQSKALYCFEKALKPLGKLWIQMPVGLPKAMEQSLKKPISTARWRDYFLNFSPPWRFYNCEEYKNLLLETGFTPTRLEIVTKYEVFLSRSAFHNFLKQWFPYLLAILIEEREDFLNDLLDKYFDILPLEEQGKVRFVIEHLEVEAIK